MDNQAKMITQSIYDSYLDALLVGNRQECTKIVQELLGGQIRIRDLYTDLFQKSLYQVGELWESNKITVAREHLATAITEGLLNLVYPELFKGERRQKKIVVSCAANEFHQIGGKMIADIFEINGWDAYFLGANTPADHMLAFIDDEKPDLAALSLSIYFNMPALKNALDAVHTHFPNLDILVGGQAFRWGGENIIKKFKNTNLITSMDDLEKMIPNL
jgi:methanogenic corrinoid protein MtbC1